MLSMLIALIIVCAFMYKFGKTISHALTATLSNRNEYSARDLPPVEKIKSQDVFFKTVFTLLGYIAKSDGRVNKTEILLVYLINLARMDGLLVEKELDIIHEVASGLGFSSIAFNHLLKMISSQNQFSEQKQNQTKQEKNSNSNSNSKENNKNTEKENKKSQDQQLIAAYEALGISPDASDSEIKKAYRKLINQYHPDKLMGQGVPDFIIKSAGENFRKIQAAYLYIKKSRP